jgi:choice-of-anchor C domain-containing protein
MRSLHSLHSLHSRRSLHSRPSRYPGHRYRAWLAVAAALASISTMVGIPLTAAPASASTDTWVASGPGTVSPLSDGATDSNPAFSYYYCSVSGVTPESLGGCTDGGASEQTWTFAASPAAGETQVAGTYLWTGNHAWCGASAELEAYVVTGSGQTTTSLVNEGNSCNTASPYGPFEFSGPYTFQIPSGATSYGFSLSGSNGDSNSFLQGTFIFETASALPAAPVNLVATPSNGAVNLSWTAPTGPAPSGYLVFEGTSSGGEIPDPVASVSGTTTTADITSVSEVSPGLNPPQTLTNGTTYYFTVVAVYGTPAFGYTNGDNAPATASPPSSEVSATPADNLILNGSFESPAVAPCSDPYNCSGEGFEDITPSNGPVIPGWTVGGDGIDLNNNHWQAEDGSQSVDLAGDAPGSVSQTVATVAGQTYTLSWWMAGNPDNGAAIKTMDVYWGGALVDSPTFDITDQTDASMGWVEEQVNVIATSTSSSVEFADASEPPSGFGATLDNVSLVPASTNTTLSTALSASSPTVAGVETVPSSVVPTSAVGSATSGSTGAASIQLGSIQLGSSQLGSIQLGSIPLGPIYTAGTAAGAPSGLQAAAQTLSSSLLSDIGITYPQGCSGSSCTGWAGILAGSIYANVPLEAVTLADVLTDTSTGTGGQLSPAAAFNSVNLASLNLASSQLGSIQLGSIQLGSIQLGSIGLGDSTPGPDALQAWCTALAGLNPPVLCSNFGITTDSDGTLTNTDNVTLLTLALAGVQLGSIQLGSIQLGSIQLGSIQLGSIQLGSIQLGSIDLANNALLQIPIGSIPDLASTQLGSIQLGSIQLGSIQLGSIQLGSIQLGSIQLGSIQLGSIPLSDIADLSIVCTSIGSFTCSPTATLEEAYQAGAITTLPVDDLSASVLDSTTLAELAEAVPNLAILLGQLPASDYNTVTLSQLLTGDNASYPGYPNPLTLADLLLTTVPPASYPWQSVTLSSLPLAANATNGGDETYTATITVGNVGSTVQVSVSLPSSFAYVPGSTTLDGAAAVDPTSGSSLTWDFPLGVGTHTLTFEAAAGIGLGAATATLSASVAETAATSSAAVDVVDGDQPSINSASTAVTLTPGTPDTTPVTQGNLNIGYVTSAGDLNDWAVTVPSGDELSLALSNFPLSDQYDLELFGPGASQLQGTPNQDLPGVDDVLPSLASQATTEPTPGSQDLPVTPPAGDQLEAISNNPAGQAQYIQTTPLAGGTYIVQVSGYNGAFSTQPYLLQANLLGGATQPSCPGGISYLDALGAAASPPVAIPNGVNTLFLVDTQRLTAAFGASSEAAIMSNLEAVASGTGSGGQPGETGVNGAIIPVDAYSSVQNAYSQWNANPCSVSAANGVVTAIAAVVDQIRADNPTVQNVVIVGADDQIPLARVPDGATQANERDYGAATFAGENNVEGDALSLGYYFSDDPYVASQPLGVGSATLYTPQLAIGRLVESAAEIDSALSRFVTSNGNLDATTSLTTGYSFLTSGADEVSANLAANGITPEALTSNVAPLIGETWQKSDLDAALANPTPGIISLNAHFDYSRALPAYDNSNGLTTNLFTTTDVSNPSPASSFGGTLLFSMGCHSGLDIDDAEVDSSIGATPIADWAKTFADAGALWVGNTGYGYADTDTVAYSAKLMAGFAANLNGSLTIGEALTEAKEQYAAGNAILSPYDLKALMESTLYGLPMYTLNGPTTPVAPTSGPPTTTDGPTGLQVASVSVNFGQTGNPALDYVTTPKNGDYYQVQVTQPSTYVGGTQATEFRPIEPLVGVPVTQPGLVPHGALVTALSSADSADPTPAYSLPAAGSADSAPPSIGDAAFPGTLQRVATYGTFTSAGTGQGAQLDLIAGQFIPNPSAPTAGTERLFNSISANVYYLPPASPLADDYTPPTIGSSQATTSSGSAPNFVVQVTPSGAPVKEVLVLYTDGGNPGTWASASLSSTNGLTWTGTGPVPTTNGVQYIVEAVDAAGNVAVSNNEGVDFNGAPQPSVAIALAGSGPVNGYYTGTVTASITAPSGSTYVLDGSQPEPVPTSGQLQVSTSGEHSLTVTDQNGDIAAQAFAISTSQTTTTLAANPSPAVVGQQVALTASVSAASSAGGSPTGYVEFFDGTNPIGSCGGATGEALTAGEVATCTVAYSSAATHQITAGYLGDTNFQASSSSPTGLTVGPDSATVASFTVSGSTAGYGAEKALVFSATVTAGNGVPAPSGDTVTVAERATSVCVITLGSGTGSTASGSCSPTSATALPAGTYANGVTATFNSTGADPNFLAAAPATTSLTVKTAALAVTAVGGSFTYGGTVPTVTASYSGFVTGESSSNLTTLPTCSTTATSSSSVGNYSATCSGAADPNYTINYVIGTISVKPAALKITASSTTMTYGSPAPPITASYSGFVNSDTYASLTTKPTCSTTATSSSPAGNYPSSCTGAVDANYTISYISGSVPVGPAILIITASSVPMTYGGTVPTITADYSGFESGDSSSSLTTKPTCSTTATSTSPVGGYPSSCSGAADANYTIEYVPGTVTVGAAPLTITASSGPMTYGGSAPTITASYFGFVTGQSSSNLTTKPTCLTAATSSSPVGSYGSSCSGAKDTNYTISYVAGSVTVGPAALTITAPNGSKIYGAVVPAITAGYSGFVNGDSSASLSTKPTCSTTATSSSPVGSYTSSCKGAVDPNYTISYVPGTFTVSPAPLTVTASSGSMNYGGTPPAITASYSGFVNGDSSASLATKATCSTSANSSSQPGTYASLCAGAVDTNYTISYLNGTITVGFTQACITSTDNGSLTVAKGQAVCVGSGGKVTGSVSVSPGGAFWLSGGSIGGSLSSSGALGITLCGTTVTGSVSVTGTTGPVVMGGSGCAKDTLGGSMSLSSNADGVVLSNNAITGSVSLSSNAGGTTISGNTIAGSFAVSSNSGGTTISGNTITGSASVTSNTGGLAFTNNTVFGSLAIISNTGPFTYSGNTVHGSVTNTGNT